MLPPVGCDPVTAPKAVDGSSAAAELTSYFPSKSAEWFGTMAQVPKYKFVDNLRPPCSGCGRPMILTRIEPQEPEFDLRVYYCAHCEANESVIAPI